MAGRHPNPVPQNVDILYQHPDLHDWVLSVAASSDGIIASGGLLNIVYLWDIAKRAFVHTIYPDRPPDLLTGIRQVAFHPVFPYFAYIDTEGAVRVLHTATWTCVATLAAVDDCGVEIAFDHRLPRIAVGWQSGCLLIWDLAAGREVAFVEDTRTPFGLSFSADSTLLSVVREDGLCSILAADLGTVVHRYKPPEATVEAAIFSPLHPLLLIASSAGSITSWDIAAFRPLSLCPAHLANIWRCVVAQRSPLLAVRSSDGPILIWSYLAGMIVTCIDTSADRVTPMCFSSDACSLLLGGRDRSVRICPLPGSLS